jgi:HlyD family secretion protein
MRYRKTKLVIGLLILLGVVGTIWLFQRQPEPPLTPDYDVTEVVRGDISSVVSATGTLNPMNTVLVGSQVSGTIQALHADFNDRVEMRQVIAQIDPAIFKARLAEAQAKLESAIAARDKAWVGVLDAKQELGRQAGLFEKKLVAESVLDSARFAYDSAVVEHKLRTAAVAEAKAARDREQVNLNYTTIYAPIDGVIISRDVDVGQTVAASLQAPTLFTIARDLTRMQVEAEVDEAFIGMIHEGQPVSFTVFAYPDRMFQGRVAQVRLQPKVEAGVVKYNCIIHVENQDLALKPGMTATVSVEVARHRNVLGVPNAALRFVPDWPAERLDAVRADLARGQGLLWTPAGGSLKALRVRTGVVGEQRTEVEGDGLEAGLEIAVPRRREAQQRKRRFGLSLF